jgi:phage-related protein
MPEVGNGCHELRIVDEGRAWRIMYAVRSDAIAILEVFSKTTRTTPAQVLRNCRSRLSAYESAARRKESKQ